MSNEFILQPDVRRPTPRASLLDRLVFAVFERAVQRIGNGRVVLSLPTGQTRSYSAPEPGPVADINVQSSRLLWRSLQQGPLGFAESYISGEVETRNLADIFRFFLSNRQALSGSARNAFRTRLPDRLRHARRRNTRRGSEKNIAFHYDLGNAFYEKWLDPGMTYSSAYFSSPDQSLESAQSEKNARLLAFLELRDGQSLLEIGCGWGGLAEAALNAGAGHVTGLTISNEQLAYAKSRLSSHPRADRADICFRDYRDETGLYDRVASVEMIEAVGQENWPQYFDTIHNRLTPGGVAVLQAITISEDAYPQYSRRPDFIQRYIFPGGALPTSRHIDEHAARAGLEVVGCDLFGASYARTLWMWREAFLDQWSEIERLGFDTRFKRMWDYYLTYCAVGFEEGAVNVGFYKFRKPVT